MNQKGNPVDYILNFIIVVLGMIILGVVIPIMFLLWNAVAKVYGWW